MHVEVVNLIIPGQNDDKKETKMLIEWVLDNLGPMTPVHFTRFHPMYRMMNAAPTPVDTLESAWHTAKEAGLEYPYIGNVPGHPHENTFCPKCNELLIDRNGFSVVKNIITEDVKCPTCGYRIAVVM